MDRIKCKKCGEIILEGKIENVSRTNRKGDLKTKKSFISSQKPKGEIHTKGKPPNKWDGLCPKCQKERDKNGTK